MWVAFANANANAKATHIFLCKNSSINAIFNDQSFNDMLNNDIFSFEELGPDVRLWKASIFHNRFKAASNEIVNMGLFLSEVPDQPAHPLWLTLAMLNK